ncbi:hypothetical protein JCM8202_002173 [Rhodotorula sphaerocarpa]
MTSTPRTSGSSSRPSSTLSDDSLIDDQDKAWLPNLVAKYGYSPATAWLEPRYAVWRSPEHKQSNPRVQGYLARGKFYFAWGPPVCRDNLETRTAVAREFIEWATKEKKRKVAYCIVDTAFSEMLGHELGWSVLSCVREDRLAPDIKKLDSKEVRHAIRRAERAHVQCSEMTLRPPKYEAPEDVRHEINEGLAAWKAERTGTQIAAAGLHPWMDAQHRRYFLARNEHGKIVAICILAEIAHDSYQIKHAVTFPNAPGGTSEGLLGYVIRELDFEGRHGLTFGASATEDLEVEHNLGGWKIKLLGKAYRKIVAKYELANRGQFRQKFGTEDEPLHIAYRPGSFGWSGLVALMKLMRVDEE